VGDLSPGERGHPKPCTGAVPANRVIWSPCGGGLRGSLTKVSRGRKPARSGMGVRGESPRRSTILYSWKKGTKGEYYPGYGRRRSSDRGRTSGRSIQSPYVSSRLKHSIALMPGIRNQNCLYFLVGNKRGIAVSVHRL